MYIIYVKPEIRNISFRTGRISFNVRSSSSSSSGGGGGGGSRGGLGSRPVNMWGLWWTKRRWGRFSPSTSVSPANHSTDFSIIIITRG
jgi:hypothetical protein